VRDSLEDILVQLLALLVMTDLVGSIENVPIMNSRVYVVDCSGVCVAVQAREARGVRGKV